MAEPEGNGRENSRDVRAHVIRALRRALVLFLLLAATIVAVAIATDGLPHLPFDYAGFD